MEKRVQRSGRIGDYEVGVGRRMRHVKGGRSLACLGVIHRVDMGNGDPVESACVEAGFNLNELVVTLVSLYQIALSERAAMMFSLGTVFRTSQLNSLVLFKSL